MDCDIADVQISSGIVESEVVVGYVKGGGSRCDLESDNFTDVCVFCDEETTTILLAGCGDFSYNPVCLQG